MKQGINVFTDFLIQDWDDEEIKIQHELKELYQIDMGADDAIAMLDSLLQTHAPTVRLNDLQFIVFRQCWLGHSYREIATETGYEYDYIKQVGAQLWQLLSQLTGQKVTKTNVQSILLRYSREIAESLSQFASEVPLGASPALSAARQDWTDAIDVSIFYGRTDELATLEQWINADRCRVVALLGMGGMGKTTMSIKLAEHIQGNFEYLIWRSLRDAPPVHEFLLSLIQFLSDQQTAALPNSTSGQLSRLIELFRQNRCLVVLDNFDAVLQPGKRAGMYRSGYSGYGELLQRVGEMAHQSCVVLTSREKPQEIAALEGVTLPVRSLLLSGLDQSASQHILTAKGLFSTTETTQPLIDYYRGNPLALKIAATSIQDLFAGDILQFLAQGTVTFNGIGTLLERQCDRLSVAEQEIMCWLAINREPVSVAALQADLLSEIPRSKLLETLESLRWRSLIEGNATGFTQQPVVMEYVTEWLIEQVSQEIRDVAPQLLIRHALIKANTKDYLRDSQIRVILQPLVQRLLQELGSAEQLEERLKQVLAHLKEHALGASGYGAGNILNLLRYLETDLTHYDFSELHIAQANLQDVNLHQVNFAQAQFVDCAFAATFGGITCVAFSPDGQQLATSDTNGSIQIWRATNGQSLVACKGHNSWVWGITFSADGQCLVSCGQDHTVRLWEVQTGRCLKILTGHTSIVTAIALSPNHQWLASSSEDQTIRIWDLETGACLKTFPGSAACIWSVAFHPKEPWLISGGEDNAIRLWHLETGECLRVLQGHQQWVKSVDLSPDGAWIVSGGFDQTVKIWNCQTGQCLYTLQGHLGTIACVAFSPNGDTVASASYDQTVRLWDVQTGQCVQTFHKHTNRVWSVAFHPTEPLLASGGDDYAARIWQIENGQCTRTLQGHSNSIYTIALDPNHHWLASGHEDQTIKLWDLSAADCLEPQSQPSRPFRTLRGHTNRVFSVAFTPDGNRLASGSLDRTIRLWDLQTGQCLHTLQGHQSWIWAIAFSPDARQLASASYDHTVKLWDVETGECLKTLQGHTSSVLAIAFHPNGQSLVSVGYEQTIKLWDTVTGDCLNTLQAHGNRVWAVAFGPQEQLATGGDDQTIKLWHFQSGQCLQTLQGHTSQVIDLVFTSDGRQLVSSSADQTIKVWDLQTGQCLQTLQGHTSWVWSLLLCQNEQVLLSASQDETIKVWDLATGEHQKTLRAPRPYEGMNISGICGLTNAQIQTLQSLGATSH